MTDVHISTTEARLREQISEIGQAFRQLGVTPGTSGNISAKCDDGWLMTPTNVGLGEINPAAIAKLDWDGNHLSGDKPTKESVLHRAFYAARPEAGGVIHLHSTHASAVSCLRGLDPESCIPPLTPYFVMRVGRLPLVPYYRPGDPGMSQAVAAYAERHKAILLANHGPVVSGRTLTEARNAIEELEETARLMLMLAAQPTHTLDEDQIDDLRRHFDAEW